MKKLLKLAMMGAALAGGRRYKNRMVDPYGGHTAYHGYGMGHHSVMGYMPYKARKRMKRKMQKRMLKQALRQIF